MNGLRLCLILSLISICSGCATAPAIAADASVIGASASITSAYYAVKTADSHYTVIGKECLWYRPVHLTEDDKTKLDRVDREQIAANNIKYDQNCKME